MKKNVMNVVAIIPARGGSKGIQRKNIKDICGKPLVAWSICQARKSKKISSVWVTSDDDEILQLAEKYGANSIKRPIDISGDLATSESAWLHAIDSICKSGIKIDLVVGIQATSPIREAIDFDKAIDLFIDKQFNSLFTSNIIKDYLTWEYNQKDEIVSKYSTRENRQARQKIKEKYLENGSFYIFSPHIIKKHNCRLGGKIGTYVMDDYKLMQIDELEDLELCEVIMRGYGIDKNE
jgi:CMP-N,N'-diacetyllegionaminic acid synthase